MNYRHAYHAGNFADVVKHTLLLQLLAQLTAKPKPLGFIDAYAGSGMYALDGAEARKTGEASGGIGQLLDTPAQHPSSQKTPSQDMPEAVTTYLHLTAKAKREFFKNAYAGSPWLARQVLREGDQAHVLELQEGEYQKLKRLFKRDAQVGVHHRDAFEGIGALIPPAQKRGLVFIDPPFESEHKDFTQLSALLCQAYKKWPTGVYALWYPIKRRDVVDLFYKKMRRAAPTVGIKNMLATELCIYPDDAPIGLNGTGLLVINPPWQFEKEASAILHYLLPRLLPKNESPISKPSTSAETQDLQDLMVNHEAAFAGKIMIEWLVQN